MTPDSRLRTRDFLAWPDRLATIIILAGLVALLLLAVTGSFRNWLLHFMPDDSFYYLEIARHVWIGQGSTFDGINQTNGYHPLWLLLLLPIAPLINISREAGARVAMTLGILFLGIALFVLRAVAGRFSKSDRWLALLFCGSTLIFAAVYGMESPLAALIFTLFLWHIGGQVKLTSKHGIVTGLLAGALVLSRLDSALYVIAFDVVAVMTVWKGSDEEHSPDRRLVRPSFGGWIVCVVTQALVISPYLFFNLFKFGHLLPISAVFKAERSSDPNLFWTGSLLALLAIGGTFAGAIATLIKPRMPTNTLWYTALVGSALNLILVAVGGGRESYSWYFTLPVLCSGLFVTVLLGRLKARGWHAGVGTGVAFGFCLLLLVGSLTGRLSTPQFASRFDRAKWIDARAPSEAIFAEGNCGVLGYFSRRSFIDLDGLSNSFAYEQAIREDRVAEWLQSAGLNAAALNSNEVLEPLANGSFRKRVVVRAQATRQICLKLQRWEPNRTDDDYVLWRVAGIDRCD